MSRWLRNWVRLGLLLALVACALVHAQNPFKQYRETAERYDDYPLPKDWNQPAEWIFTRLKYPDIARFQNGIDLYWTMDYPRGDRHLAQGVERLTLVDARSVEQVTELDGSDDIYNWPFLYAVEVGMWDLDDEQAGQLRTFLDRGGFLMVDDFHGDAEWDNFEFVLDKVLPGHEVIDLDARDQVFHTVADVKELLQIPSAQYMQSGVTYEKGGVIPRFRAIKDARGRIRIVICHNMDLGDAIEHSDNPAYPERFSQVGYRVMTNYVVYALSH
jgi:hypothetical protein